MSEESLVFYRAKQTFKCSLPLTEPWNFRACEFLLRFTEAEI
jgi:hypothetical protein